MTERDLGVEAKTAFLLVILVGGAAYVMNRRSGLENGPPPDVSEPQYTLPESITPGSPAPPPTSDGMDCKPIPPGSWVIQELRTRGYLGEPDLYPVEIIHHDGSVQTFESQEQLPNLVFPGEQLCVREDSKQSSLPTNNTSSGEIFNARERATRADNRRFSHLSTKIQANIRAGERI